MFSVVELLNFLFFVDVYERRCNVHNGQLHNNIIVSVGANRVKDGILYKTLGQ